MTDPPSPQPPAEAAALARAVERVGDRWSLLVVHALLAGPKRFNELHDEVAGIAPNILSHRLKHLEAEGIVLAVPYSRRPPRFAYELTSSGRDLAGALRLLAQWGGAGDAVRHAACGSPAEAHWWCPTCETPVDADEPQLHHL